MSFIAGYLLGLGQGSSPPVPTPSPLSLEGIKSLKTVATVTVGDFLFEIKEPYMFFSGKINYVSPNASFDKGIYENFWYASVVINDRFAAVSSDYIYRYYLSWDDHSYDGQKYSTYFNSASNFAISNVVLDNQASSGGLPKIDVSCNYDLLSGYDDMVTDRGKGSGSAGIYPYYSDPPCFTDLDRYEYFNFVKAYLKAAAENEPVINIL